MFIKEQNILKHVDTLDYSKHVKCIDDMARGSHQTSTKSCFTGPVDLII